MTVTSEELRDFPLLDQIAADVAGSAFDVTVEQAKEVLVALLTQHRGDLQDLLAALSNDRAYVGGEPE